MSFSAAANAHMASGTNRQVEYRLFGKTNFAESAAWERIHYSDFTLTIARNQTAVLDAEIVNSGLQYSDEESKSNRIQLFADLKLIAHIAAEAEARFLGRIRRIERNNFKLRLLAEDRRAWLDECEYQGHHPPTELDAVDSSSYRQLYELAQFEGLFVLSSSGAGDKGFDEATRTRRRAWVPGAKVYWLDGAEYKEVPSSHIAYDWTSGAVQIIEDTTGKTYYISNLRVYLESAATGANQVDYADVATAALEYPKASGGMGVTSAEYSISPTGYDLGGVLSYPEEKREAGSVGALLRSIQKQGGANLDLWYDSSYASLIGAAEAPGKFRFERVVQKPTGSEDLTLYNAKLISQPVDLADLRSRIVATGLKARPLNVLTDPAGSFSDLTAGGTYFSWEKLNGGADGTFAGLIGQICNGDANLGVGVHDLPASEGGGTTKYDSWYAWFKRDLGSEMRLSRLRAVMPTSANPNQFAHQGSATQGFWPGIQVLVSSDDSSYFALAPELDKVRYRPSGMGGPNVIDVPGRKMVRPYARYLKLVMGAFKQGVDNQSDPAYGLLELEVFVDEEYRHEIKIQDSDPGGFYSFSFSRRLSIVAVDTGAETFSVAGDLTALFTDGTVFGTDESTGNDGVWTCNGDSSFSGGNTVIAVTGNITSAVADGVVVTDIWPSYYPDFLTRLNSRHRTEVKDYGDELPSAVARDAAIQLAAERTRLFRTVSYRTAGPDPRPKLNQTALAPDQENGAARFLIETLVLTPRYTQATGADYRAGVVANS